MSVILFSSFTIEVMRLTMCTFTAQLKPGSVPGLFSTTQTPRLWLSNGTRHMRYHGRGQTHLLASVLVRLTVAESKERTEGVKYEG